MTWWLSVALAQGVLWVDEPVRDFGRDVTGQLWVLHHRGAVPYGEDGKAGELLTGATALLADGRTPWGMAVGRRVELRGGAVHSLELEAAVDVLWRASDGGVFASAGEDVVRLSSTGEVLGSFRTPEPDVAWVRGPDPEGVVWIRGTSTWRWDGRGAPVVDPSLQELSPDGRFRRRDLELVDGTGAVRWEAPGPVSETWWSADGSTLLVRATADRPGGGGPRTEVVRVDLSSGKAEPTRLWIGAHLLTALSRDGSSFERMDKGELQRMELASETWLMEVPEFPRSFWGPLGYSEGRTLTVAWRQEGDLVQLYRVAQPPLTLEAPDGASSGPLVLPSVAFDPDGDWVALRYSSGELALFDTSNGARRWTSGVDAVEVVGPHVAFDVVSTGRWPMGDCVDSIIQSATPWVADGGDALVTLGHVGKGRIEADLVQVWDAATGTARHRYVFDGRTRIFGFRNDGRVVVRAEKTWLALGVGPSYEEPVVLTEEDARALQASGVLEPFLEPAGMWP